MLRRLVRTWRRDQRGVSAVEFAFILPVMLAVLCGMVEMGHAIDGWRRVTRLARTVADLTSQGDTQDPMTPGTMNDILAASRSGLRPFPSQNATIVVSALAIDTIHWPFNPYICSSAATSNATARSTGIAGDLAIPPGLNLNGGRFLLAEVSMPYTPLLRSALVSFFGGRNGSIVLKASFPWPVRNGTVHNSPIQAPEVTLPNGSPCP